MSCAAVYIFIQQYDHMEQGNEVGVKIKGVTLSYSAGKKEITNTGYNYG